jgi:DnaJ-class molecular chaperone
MINLSFNKYITMPCKACKGTGEKENTTHSPFRGMMQKCYNCNGIGMVPNDNGLHILDLIEKFGNRSHV